MEKNFADLSAYFNEQLKRSAEMITESGKFSFALNRQSRIEDILIKRYTDQFEK